MDITPVKIAKKTKMPVCAGKATFCFKYYATREACNLNRCTQHVLIHSSWAHRTRVTVNLECVWYTVYTKRFCSTICMLVLIEITMSVIWVCYCIMLGSSTDDGF